MYCSDDLLALSLVEQIIYIYSLGTYYTYLKTTLGDNIVLCKTYSRENAKQLVKIWKKKKKKHASDFSILSINDMKKRICLVVIKILSNSQNTTIFTQQA